MVSKRVDAPYTAGRGRDWVKVKCSRRQELVIVGYTDATSRRGGFGALHLGIHQPDGTLRYAGKVGTGFSDASAARLVAQLEPLVVAKPKFAGAPRGAEARRSHWVRPELVAEVEFTEWTDDGTLRHPSFKGLRVDKAARDVVEERAEPAPVARTPAPRGKAAPGDVVVAGVVISNPEKLLYPDVGLTKRDLALFYEAIGEWILPHVRNRPLTLVRCPNGWREKCFYQKSAAGSHPALDSVEVRTSDGPADYLVANSVAAVVATLQMGALELHPWGSTAAALDRVDRITFDLDPDDGLGWDVVVEAAVIVRTLLEKLDLVSFVKTTGGKGLHVVLPVEPTLGWDDVKGFCKTVADLLCRTFPDRFTPSITKSSRRGRIFIDYLRNAEGATAVAAYSLRARAQAPVSLPLGWDELKRTDVRFAHFNVGNVPRRLARLRRDPWKDFFAVRQSITREVMEQVGYVPEAGVAAARPGRRGRWRR
jgi:bifunctional non-homologous end joining protein LigD